MKKLSPLIAILLFLLVLTNTACKSYPPSFDIADFYTQQYEKVDFIEADSYIVIMPKFSTPELCSDNAIIFYPGGLVDYHSYLPLLTSCAEKGFVCFIVKMPLNFAFMNKDAAGKFIKKYPEIKNWYIAGHSLGGAMAAAYASKHKEVFEGLILLAAFSTHDISDSGLRVLSIYGSNDRVLNMNHYNKNKKNLPAQSEKNGLTEIVIDGGNHAQFSSYGTQKGDGKANITSEEQQERTAAAIAVWVGAN